MTAPADPFEHARAVADAVLYEGYVLYPYRASARKNQHRWQFGVLTSPRYAAAAGEPSRSQTECLLEAGDAATVRLRLRFLQVQRRLVEEAVDDSMFHPVDSLGVDDRVLSTWDETVEHAVDAELALPVLFRGEETVAVEVPGGCETEPVSDAAGRVVGRVVRRRWPISGRLRVSA
ncbi:MAG: hypothetical protein M3467_12020, partial [Actinomycetota bacterium]|nr:hypothetical protein [Actinomycetota bacterium]